MALKCHFHGYFNSQPHKEADFVFVRKTYRIVISTHSLTRRLTVYSSVGRAPVIISTHSLTRRLTENVLPCPIYKLHFNSQPHKEADIE